MKELGIQNLLRMFMSNIGIVNWRNNTGTGWVGKAQRISRKGMVSVEVGDVVVRNARPLSAGLCKGSADVIGITPVFITQEMVGKTLGVFTAIEVKTKTGKVSVEQENFINVIKKHGGYAGIARERDDVTKIINRY